MGAVLSGGKGEVSKVTQPCSAQPADGPSLRKGSHQLATQFQAQSLTRPPSSPQAYLADKSGQSTVPSIWINGKFIGGNSDLQAKNSSGELKKLLAE